ncbi:MAG: metallophosphoesterase [Anaerolineae bacterium]|nr:metallophosphoesterase [Anaerolineae bacterium]
MKLPKLPFETPPDREDGSSSWVHLGLILSGRMGQISPFVLLPLWVLFVVAACWPWNAWRVAAALISAGFLLADWTMLALLPRAQRSWGPVMPPLLGLTLLRVGLSWLCAWLLPYLPALAILNGVIAAMAFYATWIEPFWVKVTPMRHTWPQWNSPPLRILHLSDIHFERYSPREQAVLEHMRRLQPDLILVTGDYLNLSSVHDPQAHEDVRRFLEQLQAPLGVYAITGSPVVDVKGIVPEIFDGLPIHWLRDEVAEVHHNGNTLWLIGVSCTYREERDIAAITSLLETLPAGATNTLLLYHTPDLMPAVAELGVSLYLCGHTHGGQLRLPLFGAMATSSRWGKRYEKGLYHEKQTTLYVHCGLGMEGLGAPRARFLARPEVVVWEFS